MSLGLSVVRSTDLRVPSTLCERPSPNLDSAHQCTGAARGRYHAAASSRGAEGTTCLNDIIDEPPDRISLDGAFDSLGERAAWGGGTWRPGFRFRAGGQLVATALFNLAFCLAVATWPMRTSGRAWFIMFILTESVAWGLALYFLWQKRESANGRFQAFVLQEGFVYSRMIEIYIWTWIGILYCLYVVGLTLATLPLHFDSATLPGSRGYMWVLNFYLSFPHLLAFDPVSSTKAFKEAAVRKGYPGAAYFHSGYLSRTALLAANASVFAGLWVFACGPVGLFAQSDYDFYALYAVTALNVVLMFQILPRYANIASLLLWPVLELRLAENLASMICNGVAIVLVLGVDLAMLSGRLSKADQEMILHAAEEGENVGSGLVFSTASLLNALASGGSLAAGYVATEERLVDSAAISCRWDTAASWVLTVEQTGGRPLLHCTIMFSREQLHRAALGAWRDSCRYMWIDTLSVPQPSPEDSPQLAARKEALLRRLVPTMTSVYATVRHVFIVETECGLELGPNCYSGRTWTLQECVINKRTAVVHLDGNLSILGAPSMRVAYTGLDATFNTSTLDDLGSYLWVLSGEERDAALSTTPMQRAAFQGFANTRSAARSADKAVALGQIFFRMLFEHADVATRFMHEVAVLLAEQDGPPLLLIDNTGWEPGSMSGSADPGRVLMGRPGPLESGDVALWTLRRVPPANSRFRPRRTTADSSALRHVTRDWNPSGSLRLNDDVFANSEVDLKKKVRFASSPGQIDIDDDLAMSQSNEAEEWWLCKLSMRRTAVAVAIKPGSMDYNGRHPSGQLHQMRTCTEAEKARLESSELEKLTVTWW
eukprot:jgi/Tetstr1/461542/TSEL_006648.t1